MSEIEDNFRKWWHAAGAEKYASMMDEGMPMLKIIEMIFDAGQMAAIENVKLVVDERESHG